MHIIDTAKEMKREHYDRFEKQILELIDKVEKLEEPVRDGMFALCLSLFDKDAEKLSDSDKHAVIATLYEALYGERKIE